MKFHENYEAKYLRNSMTLKHKKNRKRKRKKIISEYIIINLSNTSDKEKNFTMGGKRQITYRGTNIRAKKMLHQKLQTIITGKIIDESHKHNVKLKKVKKHILYNLFILTLKSRKNNYNI